MNIAIVGPLDTPIKKDAVGGTEIWDYQFAEKLIARNEEVTLYASEGSQFSGHLIESVKRSEIEMADSEILKISKNKLILYSINQLFKVLEDESKFDLIHISNCNFYFYLPIIKLFKKPVLVTVHSYNFTREEMVDIFNNFPNIHYVFNAKAFEKTWPKPEKYDVIYTGINLSDFEFNPKPKDYIFWMGRIHKDKGIEDAIKFGQKSKLPLIVAGPLRNEDYFNKELKPYLSEKIKYVGELDHLEKVEYYKNARAFLMTTKREESFGLVVAEAMACGTPVLAYGRGALPEIIADTKTGFIVEPDSIEGLVEKVKLIDRIDRNECRVWIEQNFSIDKMVDNYIKLYKRLIEEKNETKN